MRRTPNRRAQAGFTLIEILAVLVILAILAAFLISNFGGQRETVEARATALEIQTLEAAIGTSYYNEVGDYPPSVFDSEDVLDGGGQNSGIECVYVALWSDGRDGLGIGTESLGNLDGDSARRSLTDLPARDLFELTDLWGNPLAYFHHRDYGEQHVYLTVDDATGEVVENLVTAQKDPKTQDWFERRGFQLVSAGPDGMFGTEDDIANFTH